MLDKLMYGSMSITYQASDAKIAKGRI